MTYHELNITMAMDFPVDIEWPASIHSNRQLAALCRCQIESSLLEYWVSYYLRRIRTVIPRFNQLQQPGGTITERQLHILNGNGTLVV